VVDRGDEAAVGDQRLERAEVGVDGGEIFGELPFVHAAPEAQVAAEFFADGERVHVGGALHRPDRVDARLQKVRDDELAVAVGVDDHPAHAGGFEPRDEALHLRQNKACGRCRG
jgi:hypothetical protein